MIDAAAARRIYTFIGTILVFPVPILAEWLLLLLLGHDGMLVSMLFPFAVLAAGLVLLPVSKVAKLLLALLLVPTILFVSMWLGFGHACSVYGECL